MSRARAIEQAAVEALVQANLPELEGFAIESLAGQVNLEQDELNLAVPSLLIAMVGGTHRVPRGDALDMVFAAVVPGSNQEERRIKAMDALMAIRDWMDAANTNFEPKNTRTEKLHPVCVAGLYAQLIG